MHLRTVQLYNIMPKRASWNLTAATNQQILVGLRKKTSSISAQGEIILQQCKYNSIQQRSKNPTLVLNIFAAGAPPHLKHISSPIKLKHKFKTTWIHVTILEKKLQFKSSFSSYHIFIKLTTLSIQGSGRFMQVLRKRISIYFRLLGWNIAYLVTTETSYTKKTSHLLKFCTSNHMLIWQIQVFTQFHLGTGSIALLITKVNLQINMNYYISFFPSCKENNLKCMCRKKYM